MRMVDLILKKRDGKRLSKEEIDFMISGYTNNLIPDYQMSAMAMAIYFRGMDDQESALLALAMLHSGDEIDLTEIEGIKVDKHSTGGVGDKTTLVVAPLVASLGVKVAKMSGRGLGHTGGTLDKLESIKGFNINLSKDEFIKQVNEINVAVVGQTGNLTPADKKLYALRDVTGTVNSIPLIASSIMSKKLASGADVIHLDVKVGSGAFMKNKEDALHLAKLMVQIGNHAKRKTTAILTDMEQPLGYAVGNIIEVKEAIDTLKGHGPHDFQMLCEEISSHLLIDAKVANNQNEAKKMIKEAIESGKALDKLAQMVRYQNGDDSYIYNPDKFLNPKNIIPIYSNIDGYVEHIDALEIGISAMILGAGRETKDDIIDPSVGVLLNKKVGDPIKENEVLAYLYANDKGIEEAKIRVLKAYRIGKNKVNEELILGMVE